MNDNNNVDKKVREERGLRAKRETTHIWWFLLTGILVTLAAVNFHYEVMPVHMLFGSSKGRSILLLSYNVHSETNGFDSSSPKMAKMIMDVNPDFVYLTEYYEGTEESLHHALSQEYPYVDKYHNQGPNVGDVFYSKWQIDSVMRYNLLLHYSTIFRVQVHHNADTLAIFCCHLSSNNQILEKGRWASMEEGRRLRCEEADAIVEALKNEQYPAIIMGDMNDLSYAEPIKIMESTGMRDAWWSGGTGYGSTYSDGKVWLRIDHVLYNNQQLKLRNISVAGDYDWSDHRALVAEFSLVD